MRKFQFITTSLCIPVGEAGEDIVVPCVLGLELCRRGRLKAERSRLNLKIIWL